MSKGSGKAREIDLGDDFGNVVLKANGAQVTISADGSIHGVPAAADDKAKSGAALQIGDPHDGGVYVGLSATDGRPLHAALADWPDYLNFDHACEVAEKMRRLIPGRENAHVPTPEELDKNLFAHRDVGWLRGTFNTSGSWPGSVYRSGAPDGFRDSGVGLSRVQWFGDGVQTNDFNRNRLPVRLVW